MADRKPAAGDSPVGPEGVEPSAGLEEGRQVQVQGVEVGVGGQPGVQDGAGGQQIHGQLGVVEGGALNRTLLSRRQLWPAGIWGWDLWNVASWHVLM